ncbi:RNA polymerase sigma factor [bacterium]|nr:RNA polymerase sigma factor [bacterium]
MEKMTQKDEHVQWMLAFQAGDLQAFDKLVQAYRRSVMAIAYRFLQNKEDAEDAAQETFVKMYKAKMRYKPGNKFSSWLFTILNHVCLNMIRYRKRHATTSMDKSLNEAGDSLSNHLPDQKAVLASDRVEQDEANQMVRKVIGELSADERMALILDHWEDKSMAEIAEIVNKSVPAVKSLLFRAKAKCRIKLKGYLDWEKAW